MTVIAPDRQATWAPAWLAALGGAKGWIQLNFVQNDFVKRGFASTVPTRYATRDLDVAGAFYHGRVVGEPAVDQAFFDSFFGVTEVTTVRVRLANADQDLDTLHTADPRGLRLTLTRYDAASATSVTEFTGRVSASRMGVGYVELEAVAPDLSVFEEPVPRGTVAAATFANAVDLGAVIPVVYGNVERHPCPYVNDDTTNNQYDYLVGRGALTVSALYRLTADKTLHLVAASEYTVETTRYSGLTTVRFTARQVDFNNAFYPMVATVTGLSAERNFARAVRTLLGDATYGLGQTVNAASFNAAEAQVDPTTGTEVTGLYCDAALTQQVAASDVLRLMLLVRGMRLGSNAAGEWTLTVDAQAADVRMTLRDGPGAGERNLLSVGERTRPPLQDSVKQYRLQFRWDPVAGYRLEVSRTVHKGLGRDVVVAHPYLRDTTAADKVVHYLARREIYGGEEVTVEASQEARKVVPGERVTLDYAPLAYSSASMEVRRVTKGLDRVGMGLAPWTTAFYAYAAGTLPTEPAYPTVTDGLRTFVLIGAFGTGGGVEVSD